MNKNRIKIFSKFLTITQISLLSIPLFIVACGNKGNDQTIEEKKRKDIEKFDSELANIAYLNRKKIRDSISNNIVSFKYLVPNSIENFLGEYNNKYVNIYDKYVFPSFENQMVKSTPENEKLIKTIYQGKNDNFYYGEDEAKLSYFKMGSGYFYNGMYFHTKEDIRKYLEKISNSSEKLPEDKYIILQSVNNTVSQTLSLKKLKEKDREELIKLANFISQNTNVQFTFFNQNTNVLEYINSNDNNLIEKLLKKLEDSNYKFNYTRINSTQNKTQYYIDNDKEDQNNLFGPIFFTGSSDIKNLERKSEWTKVESTDNIPVNKHIRSTLASNFFDLIISEIQFDVEDPLFKDHKDLMFFYFPYDTQNKEYDMENLELNESWLNLMLNIENEKPVIISKLQELAKTFSKSKKSSSFYKIPTYYYFLLDQMIETGASENLIMNLKEFFVSLGNKVNRNLQFLNNQIFKNSTFNLLAPKHGKNQNEEFDFNKYFNIGNNEVDLGSNISTFLYNIYDQFPNLTIFMALIVTSEQISSSAPSLQIDIDMVKAALERISVSFDEQNVQKNWKYIIKLWNLLTSTSITEAAMILNLPESVYTDIKTGSENHFITSTLHNLFDIKWIRNKINLDNVSSEIKRQINEFLDINKITMIDNNGKRPEDFLGKLKNYKNFLNQLKDVKKIYYNHIYVLNNLLTKLESSNNKTEITETIESYIKFIINGGENIIHFEVPENKVVNLSARTIRSSKYKRLASNKIEYTGYNTHYIDQAIDTALLRDNPNVVNSVSVGSSFDEVIDQGIMGISENIKSANSWVKEIFSAKEIQKFDLNSALDETLNKQGLKYSSSVGIDLGEWFNKKINSLSNWIDSKIKNISISKEKNQNPKFSISSDTNPDLTYIQMSAAQREEFKASLTSKIYDRLKLNADKVVYTAVNDDKNADPNIKAKFSKHFDKIKQLLSGKSAHTDSISNNSLSSSNIDSIVGSRLNHAIDKVVLNKKGLSSSDNTNPKDLDGFIDEMFAFLKKESVDLTAETAVNEILTSQKTKTSNSSIKEWFDSKRSKISELFKNDSTIWDKLRINSKAGSYNLIQAEARDVEFQRKLYSHEKEIVKSSILSKISNRFEKIGNKIYSSLSSFKKTGSYNVSNADEDIISIAKKFSFKVTDTDSLNALLPKSKEFIKKNKNTNLKDFNQNFDDFFNDLVNSLDDDDIDLTIKNAVESTLDKNNKQKLINSSSLNIKEWFGKKRKSIYNFFNKSDFFEKLRINKKTGSYDFVNAQNAYDTNYRKLNEAERNKMKSSLMSKIYQRAQKLGDEVLLSLSFNKKSGSWTPTHLETDFISKTISSDLKNTNTKIELPENLSNVKVENNPLIKNKEVHKFSNNDEVDNVLSLSSKKKNDYMKNHGENISKFFMIQNIFTALNFGQATASSILEIINVSNSGDNGLNATKNLGELYFNLSSQVFSIASSIFTSLQLNSKFATLSGKLLSLNYTFLALSWALELSKFLYDAIVPEEKRSVYIFTSDDQVQYIWDGGYKKTNWFGNNVLEETTFEDSIILKPLEIISPKNKDFLYYNSKKYNVTELEQLKKDQIKDYIEGRKNSVEIESIDKKYTFQTSKEQNVINSHSIQDIFTEIYNQLINNTYTAPFVKIVYTKNELGTYHSDEQQRNSYIENELKKAKKTFFVQLPETDNDRYVTEAAINSENNVLNMPSDLFYDSNSNQIVSKNSSNIFIVYNPENLKFDSLGNLTGSQQKEVENELKNKFVRYFSIAEQKILDSQRQLKLKFSNQIKWIEITLYYLESDPSKKFLLHDDVLQFNYKKINRNHNLI